MPGTVTGFGCGLGCARSLSDLGVRREGKRDRDQNLCKFEANSGLFNEDLRKFWPISAFPQQNHPKSDRLLGLKGDGLDSSNGLSGEPYAIPPRNLTQPRECLGLIGGRLRFLENLWGVACHPWPLGPANPWRDDGIGEFSRTRLEKARHVIPTGMPGPSARDGNRVWLRP